MGTASINQLSDNRPAGPALDSNFGAYDIGFDAAWELDVWGKFRRAVESSDASLDASVEEIKLKRFQKNQEISEQKSNQFETQRNIDRNENDLIHLRKEIKRLSEESAELKAARVQLEEKGLVVSGTSPKLRPSSRMWAHFRSSSHGTWSLGPTCTFSAPKS